MTLLTRPLGDSDIDIELHELKQSCFDAWLDKDWDNYIDSGMNGGVRATYVVSMWLSHRGEDRCRLVSGCWALESVEDTLVMLCSFSSAVPFEALLQGSLLRQSSVCQALLQWVEPSSFNFAESVFSWEARGQCPTPIRQLASVVWGRSSVMCACKAGIQKIRDRKTTWDHRFSACFYKRRRVREEPVTPNWGVLKFVGTYQFRCLRLWRGMQFFREWDILLVVDMVDWSVELHVDLSNRVLQKRRSTLEGN